MSVTNKILKPGGRAAGMTVPGGGGMYYPINGSVGFFRDDFTLNGANSPAIDSDEWDVASTLTPAPYYSAGTYTAVVFGHQGTSGVTQTLTSKDKYQIPFRVVFGVSVDGVTSAEHMLLRVRDTASLYVAQFHLSGSAGGTEHTGASEIRAGATGAAYITSAALDASAGAAINGSACHMYVIDVNYNGVTFGYHTAAITTAAITTIPVAPKVSHHAVAPMLKHNVPYVVEMLFKNGTAAAGTVEADGASTGVIASCFVRVDYVEVRQYAPDAGFHSPGPAMTYLASTGITPSTQMRWS